MADNSASLVFFTVLTQTAAGALFFRELIVATGGFIFLTEEFRKRTLIVIISILFLALTISFLHLGNPLHACYALNNLGSSWLSREILFLSLLIATLLFYYPVEIYRHGNSLAKIISIFSIILCISLLFCMIKIYMIHTVISWNHPSTPVSFILTAFLCGFAIIPAIIKDNDTIETLTAPLLSLFIIFSIVNSSVFQGAISRTSNTLFILRTSLSVFSFGIINLRKLKPVPNKTGIWRVILFVTIFSSEIINRFIFYQSFEKSGL